MTQVCKDFGLSDRGLGKICDSLNVPRPGRGDWRRMERGYQVAKPLLPYDAHAQVAMVADELESHKVAPLTDEFDITVQPVLSDPHPLVRHSAAVSLESKDRLDIRTSRGGRERANRIMDALIKGFEARGHRVEISRNGVTSAIIYRENIAFHIEEIHRSEPIERKGEQWGRPEYKHVPTGRLALKLDAWGRLERSTWADGERQRLDKCLVAFVLAAEACAAERRASSEEEERSRRLRAEERRSQEEENERLGLLLREFEHWSKAERLREFTRAAHAANAIGDAWFRWAMQYADSLDPLVEKLLPVND